MEIRDIIRLIGLLMFLKGIKMNEIVEYEHHNAVVKVRKDLKGKHRSFCLCWNNCQHFKPGQIDNCQIAQDVYKNCVEYNIVTPVFECPKYKEDTEYEIINGEKCTKGWKEKINNAQKIRTIYIIGKEYGRIKHQEDTICNDCKIKKGQYHVPGCKLEICPKCGGKVISCGCD